ncbi:hypothetical protein OKA04_03870 [Luteolibacter flavescens]|uniref:Secreted protein n=1 Tax=Luteolibacter flavescens TaxID=1859460 RepID=A0ABT3FJY5_9BACT|nr:hypothetical protein [Luteolibacter flavescens]MCW1883850.1 hypothetical protein [Luteolibacter flavescens]
MKLLRSILAVLFAIVIANPACCCALDPVHETAKTSHCCGGGSKKKDSDGKKHPHQDGPCICAMKSPKQVEDPPVLPVFTAIELPPVLMSLAEIPVPPVPVSELPQPDFHHDTGPPRLRLVMFQRFLI